jgi:four helix bundle protein
MKEFYNIDVWQEAKRLVVLVYDLVKKFPKYETYALADQLRRAANSVILVVRLVNVRVIF